jgi:hypothetical protein
VPIPYFRAIAVSGASDDTLSDTIACFCSGDQRRRRPTAVLNANESRS